MQSSGFSSKLPKRAPRFVKFPGCRGQGCAQSLDPGDFVISHSTTGYGASFRYPVIGPSGMPWIS